MTADTDMTENEAEAIRRGNEALRKVAQEEARTQQELARELGLPYADIPPEQLPHWAVDAQRWRGAAPARGPGAGGGCA